MTNSGSHSPTTPASRRHDVLCVGNALVDHLTHAELSVLGELGLVPGSMTLVDVATTERLRTVLGDGEQVPGGTVTNTAVGVASFGGAPAFIGAVGADVLGDLYASNLAACGVHAILQRFPIDPTNTEAATGRCYIIVTPDAERTMVTALGAGGQLDSSGVERDVIANAALVYFDAYALDLPDAAELVARVVDGAKDSGTKIAVGLADSFAVDRHRVALEKLTSEDANFVFGNEPELLALTRANDARAALDAIDRPGLVTTVTLGANGAMVGTSGGVTALPAHPVDSVVDVTGAGDLFAAGFCFGITHGHDAMTSTRLGTLAASEIISHLGARPQVSLYELARLRGVL